MSEVRITNTGHIPQSLCGSVWLEPGESRLFPEQQVAHLRRTRIKGLYLDFAGRDYQSVYRDAAGTITDLAYLSPMCPYEGYGVCGIHFLRGAAQRGVRLSFPVLPRPEDLAQLKIEYPDLWAQWYTQAENCLVGVAHTVPTEFHKLTTKYVIGHTMFESDRVPTHWVEESNKIAGLIFPARFNRDAFRDSGVTVPMRVVGDPIELTHYPYKPWALPANNRPFTFFSWARMSHRKMPEELVRCFVSAFGPKRSDVHLVIKTHSDQYGATAAVRQSRWQPHPNVTVINEMWSQPRLLAFLRTVDCAAFLSHGEGQYNPPLQAMAAGLPVIVPDHSGMADYATEKVCWPVETRGMSASGMSPSGQWWEPNLDHCVERMRRIVETPPREVLKRTRSARKLVETKYSLDAHMDGMLAAISELVGV